MTIHEQRNILYAGAFWAGVTTSLHVLARAVGMMPTWNTPLDLKMSTPQGVTLRVKADIRTSYYFESAATALVRCAAPDADAHMKSLLPQWAAYLEYLKVIDGFVFVADSQPERLEANQERLERVVLDLAAVGRTPAEIPLVIQCNKRDLPNLMSMAALGQSLSWPRRELVPSVAKTGEGVMAALGVLLAMPR